MLHQGGNVFKETQGMRSETCWAPNTSLLGPLQTYTPVTDASRDFPWAREGENGLGAAILGVTGPEKEWLLSGIIGQRAVMTQLGPPPGFYCIAISSVARSGCLESSACLGCVSR